MCEEGEVSIVFAKLHVDIEGRHADKLVLAVNVHKLAAGYINPISAETYWYRRAHLSLMRIGPYGI